MKVDKREWGDKRKNGGREKREKDLGEGKSERREVRDRHRKGDKKKKEREKGKGI